MLWHSDVTEGIIKAYYIVHNELGYGFTENVYHNALLKELRLLGYQTNSEQPINVFYKGQRVGHFYADIVVNDCVIVELKSVKELATEHYAQLINYLKASRYEVGLLMNLGPEAKFDRKVYANHRKGSLRWANDPTNVR